jgi:hypothetical protein
MFCPPRLVCALAPSLLFVLLSCSNASAHCFVGARFFPATLAIDDPCVADEMSLPTVGWSKTGDVPPASEVDISVEISKRITETFGVSIGETWSQLQQPGNPTRAGFGDLETTFQYQLLKDDAHELALLAGLIVDWGGTGATNAGIGTSFSFLTPTFYFGQGFGELPNDTLGWARPLALTGQIGYQIPTTSFDVSHAVSEIRGERPSAPGFLQSSDPDCRSAVFDTGYQQFRQQPSYHRHDQSGRDLGRQLFPGRR